MSAWVVLVVPAAIAAVVVLVTVLSLAAVRLGGVRGAEFDALSEEEVNRRYATRQLAGRHRAEAVRR